MTMPDRTISHSFEEERRRFSAHLLSLARSHLAVWAIDLALRLGIAEALHAEPAGLESAELAERLSLDPEMTATLCSAAYTAELLQFDGKRYRLTGGAEILLLEDAPFYARGQVSLPLGLREQLERMREDIPASRRSWWDQIGPEYPEAVAMTGRASYTRLIELVLPKFPAFQERLRSGGRVLELGCGHGVGLIKMARAFPAVELLGIDGDANSLSVAEQNLAAAGLRNRVVLRQQVFEAVDIEGGFDLAYINSSLHEARDKLATVVNCFRALNPDGMLVVSEFPFPEDRASLREDPGGFLNLMQLHEVYFGGHHITVREGQDLLKDAGFTDIGAVSVTPLQVAHYGTRPT